MRAGAVATDGVRRFEDALAVAAFGAMVVLALGEVLARSLAGQSISGSIVLVQQLTLWVTMLGAALAARSDRLLALSTPHLFPDFIRGPFRIFTAAIGSGIAAWLAVASADLASIEGGSGALIAWGLPAWVGMAILPAGFAAIAARLVWSSSDSARGRLVAVAGLAIPLVFRFLPPGGSLLTTCFLLAVVVAAIVGMPIFAATGGAALVLFWADGTPSNAVPGEAYRLTTSPMLPAIPLFALGGYLLSAGGASRRLTRLLTALFSWIPGGLAIITTLVLAFFTPLTGASGITILSMGGVLLPVLIGAGYRERTSIGLVTVAGSIGLLFFPSLPVFLYGFYARVPYEQLFVAGALPGILLVAAVAGHAAYAGWKRGAARQPFARGEAALALWEAKWDLLLPVLVLTGLVSGIFTLVESAAFTVFYALVCECFIHRSLGWRRVPGVVLDCAILVGGFMVVLAVALGFTNYLVIAEIPTVALDWVQRHIDSPLVFLLALNVFLIVVGAVMDIYSAIVVVVPLVLPMAAAYGIAPVHLAVIFLANMELGYLMPPMGENLFLSSYRFNKPLSHVYRSTLPYTATILAAVLLITFIPSLSLGIVQFCERHGFFGQ